MVLATANTLSKHIRQQKGQDLELHKVVQCRVCPGCARSAGMVRLCKLLASKTRGLQGYYISAEARVLREFNGAADVVLMHAASGRRLLIQVDGSQHYVTDMHGTACQQQIMVDEHFNWAAMTQGSSVLRLLALNSDYEWGQCIDQALQHMLASPHNQPFTMWSGRYRRMPVTAEYYENMTSPEVTEMHAASLAVKYHRMHYQGM